MNENKCLESQNREERLEAKLDLIIALLRGGCTCNPISTSLAGTPPNRSCTKCGKKAIEIEPFCFRR